MAATPLTAAFLACQSPCILALIGTIFAVLVPAILSNVLAFNIVDNFGQYSTHVGAVEVANISIKGIYSSAHAKQDMFIRRTNSAPPQGKSAHEKQYTCGNCA
jgi:hypothetical protein